jgi:hypothetical protein
LKQQVRQIYLRALPLQLKLHSNRVSCRFTDSGRSVHCLLGGACAAPGPEKAGVAICMLARMLCLAPRVCKLARQGRGSQ